MSSEGYQSFYQHCRLSIYVSTTNNLGSDKRLVVLGRELHYQIYLHQWHLWIEFWYKTNIYRRFLPKSHNSWHFLLRNFNFSSTIWWLNKKTVLMRYSTFKPSQSLFATRSVSIFSYVVTCAIRRTQKSLKPFEFFCMFSLGLTSSSSELLPVKWR